MNDTPTRRSDPAPTFGAIIEARMGSTRLPGKVMTDLVPGWPLVDVIVERARKARRLSTVVVATSTEPGDDVLVAHLSGRGVPTFRGSEDVLVERVLGAARAHGLDRIVRLTGDNPLIDGGLIDDVIAFAEAGDYDYVTTTHMGHSPKWAAERTFPRGVCIEVIRRDVLEDLFDGTDDPMIRGQPNAAFLERPEDFRLGAFEAAGPYAAWRHPELAFTVDTPQDLEVVCTVFAAVGGSDPIGFSPWAAIDYLLAHPALSALNRDLPRTGLAEMRFKLTGGGRSDR